MQIRIMGSYEECELASDYYISLRSDPDVRYVDVSKPYPNRGIRSHIGYMSRYRTRIRISIMLQREIRN